MPGKVPGKVIAITGANGGLGRALSRRFAADGDTVIMLGRNLAKVTEAAAEIAGDVWPVQCDLGNPESIRTAFARIAERHGVLDVLINNAGNFLPFVFAEANEAQIIDSMNGNFLGPVLCSRAAIPLMKAGGKLIHVTSEAVELNFAMLSLYGSGKAGLERFSRMLQQELSESGTGIRSMIFRAGQMYGEGMSTQMDETDAGQFGAWNARRGLIPPERGFTSYETAAGVMRTLVDLPADVNADIITCYSVPGVLGRGEA
jgi:meso-butanediol dehydrogenase/(S,S)-butanediol dehydrogenase/diacetyl reductase